SSDRLFNLINDILEISKIDAGEIKIENNTIEVEKEFSLLYENFLLEAQVKDLKLLLNPTYPERLLIETDKSKFLSIVINLVKNAIKYTHKGFVEFGYVYQNEHIEIIVNDTGIGIPKEKHDIIFNRFMQVDNRADKPYEGVGLGLSIVKAYVEMLHGTIELSSEKDKGTTFKVKLPAKQQSTIENQT
ncbi:MAG TPA: HAMP domain-containing sensor histidine kinase, partial [Bacteroidales bacterium]|nr:HAMP domain-containing sensor histidine kinase [Bacteroidales bacterium]